MTISTPSQRYMHKSLCNNQYKGSEKSLTNNELVTRKVNHIHIYMYIDHRDHGGNSSNCMYNDVIR